MNEAICISMVVDANGRSLWCRKRIWKLRLWRIAAATFRDVLRIGITRLQRSTTLCIGYALLCIQLLETRGLWIVWLILTFVRQSTPVTRRGLFPIPWEKSDRGFKVEHLEHFLENSGGILRQFLDEIEAGCAWKLGDVFRDVPLFWYRERVFTIGQ